jgi:hypothetical protein
MDDASRRHPGNSILVSSTRHRCWRARTKATWWDIITGRWSQLSSSGVRSTLMEAFGVYLCHPSSTSRFTLAIVIDKVEKDKIGRKEDELTYFPDHFTLSDDVAFYILGCQPCCHLIIARVIVILPYHRLYTTLHCTTTASIIALWRVTTYFYGRNHLTLFATPVNVMSSTYYCDVLLLVRNHCWPINKYVRKQISSIDNCG